MRKWKVEAEVVAETKEEASVIVAYRLLDEQHAQSVGWVKVEEKEDK